MRVYIYICVFQLVEELEAVEEWIFANHKSI